ncbi:hypothetical protein AB205_0129330 [Aquarana catesbeiana]|uniref:Tuftelin-interacting protein 11 n=1 Tax=Aquarana catesbeiana TaxID=8400 RepID=A0A2G9REK6_AQUCT|nr:hypothetical protein AB205_0129330 [Aquarana catesbeiana]
MPFRVTMSMSHLYGKDEDSDGVEMEKFEITDWDLENEFNPNRRKHWQTKEETTYGIWAERDSDDERPSFGGKKSRDYTAPVNFISAGIRKPAAEEKSNSDSDDEIPTKREELPKEFESKKLRTGGNFKPTQKTFAGGIKSNTDFGSWERHTKGIGQKLLQKMGYVQGRGLGKNAQGTANCNTVLLDNNELGKGIIAPIEAKQRKGKGAVGAYGSERTKQSLKDFPVVDSEDEEEQVIDMTGREQKVYYSYSQFSHKHNVPGESTAPGVKEEKPQGFALPELEHNLQLLIDMTEQEIIQNDRQLQYEKDMVVNLTHELEKLSEVMGREEKAIYNLSQVLKTVEECEQRLQPGCENPLTLDECARVFQMLQDKYYEEYKMSGQDDLAVALVYPLVKEYFKDWNPLRRSQKLLEIMSRDYTAPVNFISAGIRKPAAEEKSNSDSDDEIPTKREELPKEFESKKLRTGGNFKPTQKTFAGGIKSNTDFGSWERHTKGIGQKLLQKMGYVQGRGLGKNAQGTANCNTVLLDNNELGKGIIAPIEAKQRKGKGAVGAYGSERTKQSLKDFPVVDSEDEEEQEFQKELSQWRKDPGGAKKKPKYAYKTVEELKAKGKGGKIISAPQKEISQVKTPVGDVGSLFTKYHLPMAA